MSDLIELERQKWEAFRTKDADLLGRMYHPDAISIGYAGDGSLGARRTPELLSGLHDLDLQDLSLEDFEVVPVGEDGAVVTYRASFTSARGMNTAVKASSVWHREGDAWRTMFFQATAEPLSAAR